MDTEFTTLEVASDRIYWNGGYDGLSLTHVTHWHFQPAKNPEDPESQDHLFVYLAAPATGLASSNQAVAVYKGDVARRLMDCLSASGVWLP